MNDMKRYFSPTIIDVIQNVDNIETIFVVANADFLVLQIQLEKWGTCKVDVMEFNVYKTKITNLIFKNNKKIRFLTDDTVHNDFFGPVLHIPYKIVPKKLLNFIKIMK